MQQETYLYLFYFYRSYRMAQAAVIEGLPKLKRTGIPTKRPDDYYAEMVKTDDHMKKVSYNSYLLTACILQRQVFVHVVTNIYFSELHKHCFH